jgi:hypothetical protein
MFQHVWIKQYHWSDSGLHRVGAILWKLDTCEGMADEGLRKLTMHVTIVSKKDKFVATKSLQVPIKRAGNPVIILASDTEQRIAQEIKYCIENDPAVHYYNNTYRDGSGWDDGLENTIYKLAHNVYSEMQSIVKNHG